MERRPRRGRGRRAGQGAPPSPGAPGAGARAARPRRPAPPPSPWHRSELVLRTDLRDRALPRRLLDLLRPRRPPPSRRRSRPTRLRARSARGRHPGAGAGRRAGPAPELHGIGGRRADRGGAIPPRGAGGRPGARRPLPLPPPRRPHDASRARPAGVRLRLEPGLRRPPGDAGRPVSPVPAVRPGGGSAVGDARAAARRHGRDARRGPLPRPLCGRRPRPRGRDARAGGSAGGSVSVLWHNDRFDPAYARGWDRAYDRLLRWVRERGGRLCTAAEAVGLEAGATPRR